MAGTTSAPVSARQQYLNALERETATTFKVLRAYPADKGELRPHEKTKTARELSFVFALEMGLAQAVLTNTLEMPPSLPPVPDTIAECISAFEAGLGNLRALIEGMSDDDLYNGAVKFLVGPKTMGDIPKLDFLWFMLHDMIHHRGQFSIYLRMADGKVPSIYGPSADEPWY